jgi:hypothetical protein
MVTLWLENAALRAQNAALQARIRELEARLGQLRRLWFGPSCERIVSATTCSVIEP